MKMLRVVMMVGLIVSLGINLAQAKEPVKVAILDSGSNTIYKEGISLIDSSIKDYNGHGTLMARIVKEAYPEAQLYIVKVMGKDGLLVNEKAIVRGIEWAVSRDVDIINMSLKVEDSPYLHDVVRKAHERGIVIVAAAGNKDSIKGTLTARSILSQSSTDIAYPARYQEVISVGALDKHGRVYEKSMGKEEAEILCRGYKGKKAGTSIACAYAAGFIAKIISENSDIGMQDLRALLQEKHKGGQLK